MSYVYTVHIDFICIKMLVFLIVIRMLTLKNFIGVYLVIFLTAPIAPFSLCIYSDRRDGDCRYGNYRKDIVLAYMYYYTFLGLIIWSLVIDLIVADLVFWFRLISAWLCLFGLLFGLTGQVAMVTDNYIGRRIEYVQLKEARLRRTPRSGD